MPRKPAACRCSPPSFTARDAIINLGEPDISVLHDIGGGRRAADPPRDEGLQLPIAAHIGGDRRAGALLVAVGGWTWVAHLEMSGRVSSDNERGRDGPQRGVAPGGTSTQPSGIRNQASWAGMPGSGTRVLSIIDHEDAISDEDRSASGRGGVFSEPNAKN